MERTNLETFLLLQRRYMDMISGLTSSEARTLIDKFYHWNGILGAEIISVRVERPKPGKKKKGTRENRLSAQQFKALMKLFTEYIERRSRDDAELMLSNMELGRQVARGKLETALVSIAKNRVRINHGVPIETRAKCSGCETYDRGESLLYILSKFDSDGSGIEHAALELVSFCAGINTHKRTVQLLRRHGFEPADISHALAFVRANPPKKWTGKVFRVNVPGSVGRIGPSARIGPLICPVLHAPTSYNPNWTLGYDRVASRYHGKYHMGTGFESWILAVRKEDK